MKMKWKSTCCLQISSVFKWIFSILNVVFSEIWNVYSNQIKSNQIKSYFPISHIPYKREYPNYFPEFEWVKEDLNNYYHNTIHISFHFNLLFMINVLSKLSWPLMIVLRLSRLSPWRTYQPSNEMVCSLGRSRMINEMKMKNHHILSNTATWQ